jgi:hypothetical protein
VKIGGKTLFCGVLAVLVIFIGAFLVTAQEKADCPTEAPKGKMEIKSEAWEAHTKCPVDFSHQAHAEDYEVACVDCHHVFEDGKNVWKEGDPACACASCHTDLTIEGEKKLPPEQQKLNLKLAYHENCQGCHRNLKKEDPKTAAPVTCTGCHPKECP